MITQTNTLSCRFRDNLGASRSISIDSPNATLTPDEVFEFMQLIIDANVLMPNRDHAHVFLESINNATIVTRTTETIGFNQKLIH